MFAGRENNIIRNAVDSEWDAEQTAAAISTAAMSAAAASVQCGDGWQASDDSLTLLASEWYSFVSPRLLHSAYVVHRQKIFCLQFSLYCPLSNMRLVNNLSYL